MGKASKWFKGLFGFKRSDPDQDPNPTRKKKWIFAKSHKEKHYSHKSQQARAREDNDYHTALKVSNVFSSRVIYGDDHIRKSISSMSDHNVEWDAAIVIQSHFRAYLSRRALRALKALVKLQALVRGHIMRKQTADILRRMQVLVRAQQRARLSRFVHSETIYNSHLKTSRSPLQIKYGPKSKAHNQENPHSNRSRTRDESPFLHEFILEVDDRAKNPSHTPKKSTLKKCLSKIVDESSLERSSKSDGSKSCLSGNCSDQPSYMFYTESSRAKSRSLSAPRQRIVPTNNRYARSSSTNYRCSLHHESRMCKNNIQEFSALSLGSKANNHYHGSGSLDRLGMPVRGGDHHVLGFNGSYWN